MAITSTLSVFEAMIPGRPLLNARMLETMSHDAALSYLSATAAHTGDKMHARLKKEMELERAFVAAGGLPGWGISGSGFAADQPLE